MFNSVSRAQFWRSHAKPALLLFIGPAFLCATTQLDPTLAGALFFDYSGAGWIGADRWFVNELIHTGGRWSVRVVAALALALWATTFLAPSLRNLRRPAGYFVSAVVLTVGIVGLLKTLTNVDCPWDLTAFGGRHPYLDLFSARPDDLPRARCFPAAHASSGYAFMALYFLGYERSRMLARFGLAAGLLLGLIFGVAQQSRGAHFISHDLWSALFAWMIPLTLYAFAFDRRLYAQPEPCASRCSQPPQRSSFDLLPLLPPKCRALWSEPPSETCSTTCGRGD